MDEVEKLIAELDSEDDDTWIWAARDLAELQDARAVVPLCRMLMAADDRRCYNWPAKVIEAAEALGKIADRRAVPFLSATLQTLKKIKQRPDHAWLGDWVLCAVDNAIQRCNGLPERYNRLDSFDSL